MTQLEPQGFFASPPAGTGSGVLVLHAWWGLNETIKSICRRLAASGFVAFAPDLYHGKVATTIPEAEQLGRALDNDHLRAKTEIATAAKLLVERADQSVGGIAVIGFSLGAYYSVHLAGADPEHVRSVVLFYGTGDADLDNSRASFLGHFAGNDAYEPQKYADKMEAYLKRIGRPVTFYRYPGAAHWFFEPDRTQEYSPEAANLAWERTLVFLRNSVDSNK